jgi:hypothetical protein
MNADAALTVDMVRARGWECLRLGPRMKRPTGQHWVTTQNADEVARWFQRGHNVGLVVGEQNGVAVLECQRGPNQQVVLPGSIHPEGGTYKWITESLGWLVEPIRPVTDPLPKLHPYWRIYLQHDALMKMHDDEAAE